MVQIIQCFSVFNGPNRSGAGAKNLEMLEPELKNLDAWSLAWNLSSGATVMGKPRESDIVAETPKRPSLNQ